MFEGLWIEPQWDWNKTHPVIHLSFDAIDYHEQSLSDALKQTLFKQAQFFGLELTEPTLATQFKELLEKLYAKHSRMVLLVDEYDKPIIDYLERQPRPGAAGSDRHSGRFAFPDLPETERGVVSRPDSHHFQLSGHLHPKRGSLIPGPGRCGGANADCCVCV